MHQQIQDEADKLERHTMKNGPYVGDDEAKRQKMLEQHILMFQLASNALRDFLTN